MTDRTGERFFRDLRLPWFECRYSIGSSRSFKPHMHRSLSIGALARGKAICSTMGRTEVLEPGALVIFNPETVHCCNGEGHGVRDFLMLHLGIEWCLTVQQSMWSVNGFVPASTVLLTDSSRYSRFCQIMQTVMNLQIPVLKKEGMLGEMMIDLFEQVCVPQIYRTDPPTDMSTVKQLLKDDLHQNLSLNDLAARLRINPYSLLRRFKAETGLSPHSYRMNCRIEKARLLLQQGMDIAETALECGFFDQSHLHRNFKAMTTVTPRQYQVNFVQ